jgi:hypothetical protein
MKTALLDQLRETIRRQPTRLGQLHAQAKDAGSGWTREQVRLLLEAYEGFTVGSEDDPEISLGAVTHEEGLLTAVRHVLSNEPGRPVPIARVIELLPSDLTTSVEQLRALATKTADLEIRGALIRCKPLN